MARQSHQSDITWVIVVIVAMVLLVGIDKGIGDDPPNNEPYTGLCVEPKTQGGC
jgi:hypothetical protein